MKRPTRWWMFWREDCGVVGNVIFGVIMCLLALAMVFNH